VYVILFVVYFSQLSVFYGLGMWLALSLDCDAVLRAVIIMGGVAMAYLLYRKTVWER